MGKLLFPKGKAYIGRHLIGFYFWCLKYREKFESYIYYLRTILDTEFCFSVQYDHDEGQVNGKR